jgi:hypothetical protein
MQATPPALSGLEGLEGYSRLLTGLGLLLRPTPPTPTLVVAVPLEDAEENLRALAASTTTAGGELLLVPEYTEPFVGTQLLPYWDMEKRLATELPHVHYLDLHPVLSTQPDMLVDRNHLSRSGSQIVADQLLPAVLPLLTR